MHHTRWQVSILVVVLVLVGAGVVSAEEPPAASIHEGRDAAAWGRDLAAEDLATRQKAVYALWHLRTHARDLAPALAKALRDEDEYMRKTAERVLVTFEFQKALGTLSKAMPELVEALGDDRASVRLSAVSIIWLAGPQPNVVGGEPPPATLMPALLRALVDGDSRVRANAAASLANIQKDAAPALPALRQALGDEDPKVRMWTVRAVSWIGAAEEVPAILRCARDKDAGVRAVVYSALAGATGTDVDAALAALTKGMQDEDPTARTAAVNGIWGLGDVRALPALVALLEKAKDPLLIGSLANVIGGLGDPRGAAPLLKLLEEEKNPGRLGAVAGLARLGPEGAVALPQILPLLQAATPEQKRSLALSIGQFGALAPAALPVLTKALSHEDPGVRGMAASSLSGMASQGLYDDALLAAATRGLGDDAPEVRQYSLAILYHAAPDSAAAVPAMMKRLAAEDEAMGRAVIYNALARMGPAAAAATHALQARQETADLERLALAAAIASVSPEPKDVDAAVQVLMDALAHESTRDYGMSRLKAVGAPAKRAALALRVWMKGEPVWAVRAAAALLQIEGREAKDAVALLNQALAGDRAKQALRDLGEVGPAGLALQNAILVHAMDVGSPLRSLALTRLLAWEVQGDDVRAAYALARKDATPWLRTLGYRGLQTLER